MRRVDPAAPGVDEQRFGDWLAARGQSNRARRALWDLFTVSALNIAGDDASLSLAATVVKTGLLGQKNAADVGVPALPLGELHGDAAATLLAKLGAQVLLNAKVAAIDPAPAPAAPAPVPGAAALDLAAPAPFPRPLLPAPRPLLPTSLPPPFPGPLPAPRPLPPATPSPRPIPPPPHAPVFASVSPAPWTPPISRTPPRAQMPPTRRRFPRTPWCSPCRTRPPPA